MQICFSIDDQEILEAIAERYPNAGVTLAEIKQQLEGKFIDTLTNDREYVWHLMYDRYFDRLAKFCNDRQEDAEDLFARESVEVYEETRHMLVAA
jgi:DNA-binding transcriptional MerR regulator